MVRARGVVRNTAGAEIENATVRIAPASPSEPPLAVLQTTVKGCFDYSDVAPRDEKRFTLDVSAPGYKPVRFDFGIHELALLVVLAPESSEPASQAREMTFPQTQGIYEPLCLTAYPRAASGLGPS